MELEQELNSGYSSARDDRDYLLEYKAIDLDSLEHFDLLGVRIDNVTRDEAIASILHHAELREKPTHILFLDPLKFMRVRPGKKLSRLAENSHMNLVDGGGLDHACEKLGYPIRERIPMISLIMDLIRAAWKKNLTIYFLGSRLENLEKINKMFQRIYPGIRIIGRQSGYFDAGREALIKESIRKSSPHIVLLGMGFPRQEIWMEKNREFLGNAVVISVDGAFDVLSGAEKKAPDSIQLNGYAWLWRTFMRPWNVVRFFTFLSFYTTVFIQSLKKTRAVG